MGMDREFHDVNFPPVPKETNSVHPDFLNSLPRLGTERERGMMGLENCPHSNIKMESDFSTHNPTRTTTECFNPSSGSVGKQSNASCPRLEFELLDYQGNFTYVTFTWPHGNCSAQFIKRLTLP